MKRRDFALTLAGATQLAGQQTATGPGSGDTVIRVGTSEVIAPTTVLDRDGNFVSGLTADDFQLFDNERPQKIKVDVSYIPISMVIAIQNSAQAEKVLPTIARIGGMIEPVITGEQGEVSVLAFDHRLQLLQGFTNDFTKVKEALGKLRPGSNTVRLNDAVMEAARMLGRTDKSRRRVLMLISETQDRGSEGRVKDTLYKLEFENVIVYPVNMSRWVNQLTAKTPIPRPDPFPVGTRMSSPGGLDTPTTAMQNGLGGGYGNYTPVFKEIFTAVKAVFVANPQEAYTKYTGGKEYSFVNLKGLEEAIQRLGEELHSQYLLSYAPTTETRQDAGWHKLQVSVKRRNVEVRTRAGYWAAAKFEP
ncbi:MAG: VWA domain-containing protein [Bryobacteraceae bacterium]|nr:VWA domain-containing protein [Bryobacteraceae bacterium]